MLAGKAEKEAIERAITQAKLYAYLHKSWEIKNLLKRSNLV
jgi:hypothetical protein